MVSCRKLQARGMFPWRIIQSCLSARASLVGPHSCQFPFDPTCSALLFNFGFCSLVMASNASVIPKTADSATQSLVHNWLVSVPVMLVCRLAHSLYHITWDTLLCLGLSTLRQWGDGPYSVNENTDSNLFRYRFISPSCCCPLEVHAHLQES